MSSLLLVSYCVLVLGRIVTGSPAPPPTVQTVNGTYTGLNLESFSQEAFYGIPYATPPLGDLRLRRALPFDQSWTGTRKATVRSDSCPGYNGFPDSLVGGSLIDGLTLGEDCLTIDIVRPANTKPNDDLPVFVWIYGGGLLRVIRFLLRW
jgi:carboxylesterase type B